LAPFSSRLATSRARSRSPLLDVADFLCSLGERVRTFAEPFRNVAREVLNLEAKVAKLEDEPVLA
jgi:hypothetical protein